MTCLVLSSSIHPIATTVPDCGISLPWFSLYVSCVAWLCPWH